MDTADPHTVRAVAGLAPAIDDRAWLADGARVVGDVTLGPDVGVWFNAVLRGDGAPIVVGARSNVQDGVVVHVDADAPATIGADVSIGHGAVVHGATVGDACLIGMRAVVLSGAVVGAGSLVAAGSVVLEGREIPPGSLVAGSPATVRRPLRAEERAAILANAADYVERIGRYSGR